MQKPRFFITLFNERRSIFEVITGTLYYIHKHHVFPERTWDRDRERVRERARGIGEREIDNGEVDNEVRITCITGKQKRVIRQLSEFSFYTPSPIA